MRQLGNLARDAYDKAISDFENKPVIKSQIGPDPGRPKGVYRVLRTGFLLVIGWISLTLIVLSTTLLTLLTLRIGFRSYLHRLGRPIGRYFLWLEGVRLEVLHLERIEEEKARLILFNHASQLDLFICGGLYPKNGNAVAKKEILRIPMLGLFFWIYGIYLIDRDDLSSAKNSLAGVAKDLRKRRVSVMMSPEGTRSKDGSLLGFKKGPFHLAAESKVPIVPMIIRGASDCQPMGQLVSDPGVVQVEFLPEISTEDFTHENVHEKAAELRAIFERALAEVPSDM